MKNVRRIVLVAILAVLIVLHDHVSSYIVHYHHVSACQLRSMYSCKVVTLGVHHNRNRITKMKPLQVMSDATASVENTELVVVNKKGSVLERIRSSSRIMYKFSRPHTIKGTILASIMGVLRALIENPSKINPKLLPKAVIGLTALLCGNAYIVGINQIYDEKIDEINKPFLPIAAKLLTKESAWVIIAACLASGIAIVKTQFSPQIFALYMIGLILGSAYSVPPLQLKRFPVFAGSIIAFVRGFLLNFGVYYAVREALSVPFKVNPTVVFIASFMTVFASVIAVTKDLPDVEGDKLYNVSTFASKYGVVRTAAGASTLLCLAYLTAIALPFVPSLRNSFNKAAMVLGHSLYLLYFLSSYSELDAENATSLKRFYKAIWNLFYLEYCLYPFI